MRTGHEAGDRDDLLWDWVMSFQGWLFSLTKEKLALIGALTLFLLYAWMYEIYFQFYASFGLRPGDVGLSRLRLLEESILGPLFVPFGVVADKWVWVFLIGSGFAALRLIFWVSKQKSLGLWPGVRDVLISLLAGMLLIVLPLTVWRHLHMHVEAANAGDLVRKQGMIVVRWLTNVPQWMTYFPYLEIQALPVDVLDSEGKPINAFTEGCGLYLGQLGEAALILDVRKDQVVQVPTKERRIVFHPATRHYPKIDSKNGLGEPRLPTRCTSDEGNEIPDA